MNELFEEIYDLPMPENDNELVHYGVPGMKWGKRKEYVPVGRNKRVTDTGTGVHKTGSGLGTGKVGTGAVSKPRYSNPADAQKRAAQVARYRKLTQQVSKRLNKTVSASQIESTIKEVVSEAVSKKKGSGGGSKKKAAGSKAEKAKVAKASKGGGSGKKGASEKKSSEKKAKEEKAVKEKAFKMTSQFKSTIKSLHSEMLTAIKQRNANFNARESWFDEKDPESFTYWMGDLQAEFWDRIPDELKKDDDFSEEAKTALKDLYDDLKKAFDKEEATANKKKEQADAKAKREKEAADKKAASEKAKKEKEAAQEKVKSEKEKARKEAIAKAQETQRKRAEEDERRKRAVAKARSLLHSYHFEITKKEYQAIPDPKGDYISHHGVQGQKWGVRNGPPYPLSRQGITRSNYGKAMAFKKKDLGLKKSAKPGTSEYHCKTINKTGDINWSCSVNCFAFELRKRGYDVTLTNKNHNELKQHCYDHSSLDEQMSWYNKKDYTWADEKVPKEFIKTDIAFFDKSSPVKRFKNGKSLEAVFKDQPKGSRGVLAFMWADAFFWTGDRFGHVINWEKQGNKVVFWDCQNGKKITPDELAKTSMSNSMSYFRTDDGEINEEALKYLRKVGGF